MNELWTEAAGLSSLAYDGVHPPVDADASVTRPLEGLFWEPVVSVPAPEDLHQAGVEFLQLSLGDVGSRRQPY